jgi:uncharacterized protein YbcI
VRLLREYTGRGPTKARTHFNDNLITVVVQSADQGRAQPRPRRQGTSCSTRAEPTSRHADLTGAIEEITGRHVIAFLSANHIDPDIAIESFMLAPPRRRAPANSPGHARLN